MAKQRKKRGRPSSNNSVIEAEEETENEVKNDEVSGYEQSRDQRIKENLQRMQKLGILDLSRQLNPPSKRPKKNPSQKKPSLPSSDPPRRSSRLMAVTRVTYKEVSAPKKKHKSEESDEIEIVMKEGLKPEIYTEEDEKLLGDCETAWILNVDGYGEDGERIYDPFFGKSCHQCRSRKLLVTVPIAASASWAEGSFVEIAYTQDTGRIFWKQTKIQIGFALYVEEFAIVVVVDVLKDGNLLLLFIQRVSKRGFKSVAHYLIQTRRSQTKQEEPADGDLVSADKSPFADVEVKSPLHDEGVDSQLTHDGVPNPQSKDNNNVEEYSDDEYKEEDDNHDSTDTDDDDDDDD
ncbi:unnamed protein product [Camellia sinensis]